MKTVLSILLLFSAHLLHAQKQGNIWFFGDHAGVDFNSGSPVSVSTGQTYMANGHNEGTSVICDSSGALLFYTNGEEIWNRFHQLMPNGDSLMGHLSSTQGALVIPQPGTDHVFYVFTTDSWYQNNLANGLRYSKVDMCMDKHNGDVIPGEKNMLLLNLVSEKLTAVKHANNTDYWIIAHRYYSNEFHAFLLSASGISSGIVSAVGSIHEDNCPSTSTYAAIGQMKASPDGTKIALGTLNTCDNLRELFDFDRTTGVVSNFVDLEPQIDTFGCYGVSFSPDNTKLYFASNSPGKIYQYDITAGGGNPDSIRGSKIKVVDIPSEILGIQLGPDGKIYASRGSNAFLAVINSPNTAGFGCNFVDNAVPLSGQCSFGMPNLLDSYDYHNALVQCDLGEGETNSEPYIRISPNPVDGNGFYISFDQGQAESCTLFIYDNLGRVVRQTDPLTEGKIFLEKSSFAPGLYFILIRSGDVIHAGGKLLIR